MKRLGLIISCCFLLSGCIFDPTFDMSSLDAFQKSTAAIKAKLSNEDLRRLDIALRYLLAESGSKSRFNASTMNNPYVVLSLLGPRINGLDAATLIANLSVRLDTEIAETEARLPDVNHVLAALEVSSPSYSWGSDNFGQPVIEFTVRNVGKSSITRAAFNCILTTSSRSIPWATQTFVQTFRGGLEPHEKQVLTFRALSGEWTDTKLQYLSNAELKVTVANFEDANQQRVVAVDTDSLELKHKILASLQQ